MMVSPSSLIEGLKRSGWGGRRRLVPFFKCVCVYWAVGSGGGGGGGEAAAKCAPVLWLAGSVAHAAAAGGPRAPLRRRVALGLALSALGDALLVWPRGFVPGMAAFAGAHVAYTAAFHGRGARAAPALGALLYASTALFVTQLRLAGALRALVPVYAALLATMAWRAAAAAPRPAALGGLLFLLSDAILGYALFREPVPYRRVLVMSTYYLGQLGIALGALDAEAPPSPPPLPPAATLAPAVAAY